MENGFTCGNALQNAFIRKMDVINRGFSGYNSSQALETLSKFMPGPSQAKVRLFYIFLGANDAAVKGGTRGQYVPLDIYKVNLEKIINHPTVQAHKPHIFLINPPPVNEYQLEELGARDRTAENTKKYADACLEVASKLGVPVVDIWGTLMKKAGWVEGQELAGSKKIPENKYLRSVLIDGLHFLAPVYEILFDEIMSLIKREFPDCDPTDKPMVLPPWENAFPKPFYYG